MVQVVFAYVADEDKPSSVGLTERHELQRQGIEVAKAEGRHLGRPRIGYPENWETFYEMWKSGEITAKKARELMGLKKDSFYRLVKNLKWQRKIQVKHSFRVLIY